MSSSPEVLVTIPAKWVAVVHTVFALAAFSAALASALSLHYVNVVKNEFHGYPAEWFPSVSATIGDWFPDRNVFQILIALTATPRFLLILSEYVLFRQNGKSLAGAVAIVGLLRTFTCGGWVYITSTDSGLWHDVFMISYLVLTLPWMFGCLYGCTNPTGQKCRKVFISSFLGVIPPLVYFYIQHKKERVAGAYSYYAYFEWTLVFSDVLFDAGSFFDLNETSFGFADSQSVGFYLKEGGKRRSEEPKKSAKPAATLPSRSAFFPLPLTDFVYESFYATLFWSNLTALGPMIFYSSVWSMGLSGLELLVFVTLSPIILIKALRSFIAQYRVIFDLVSLLGPAAHTIDDLGETRLMILSACVGLGTLVQVSAFADATKTSGSAYVPSVIFGVGLVSFNLLKFANFSLSPFWPFMSDGYSHHADNGGYNTIAITLGVLMTTLKLFSGSSQTPAKAQATSTSKPNALIASIGYGTLFFVIHWLFSDSGTAIAWSFSGYPLKGPTAMPHGIITIAVLALSLSQSLTTPLPVLYTVPFSALTAGLGSFLLHTQKDWASYLGGLLLGMYCMVSLPNYTSAISAQKYVPLAYFTAFLAYAVFELASVFTVAYAFVPYGNYFREETRYVLGAAVGLLFLNDLNLCLSYSPEQDTGASAVVIATNITQLNQWRKRLLRVATGVVLVGVATIQYRKKTQAPIVPHQKGVLTAGIWTVHFGLDGKMWESQRRIADLMRDAQVDVFGLLESDLHRIVMGNRDISQYVSNTLGYYSDIGPGPNQHTWGCTLFSKYPIVNSTHHLLPSPAGELAPAIRATLDVTSAGQEGIEYVDVVVAHNGQEEDPLDRELQSRELARIMREDSAGRPVVYIGYVVTNPHAPKPNPYGIFVGEGDVHDIDIHDSDRWCQYMFYRGLRRVAYARLNRGSNPSVTDTEIQLGKFVIDSNSPKDANYQHVTEQESQYAFPSYFKGEGVRGHRYQGLTNSEGQFDAWYY